MSKPTFKLKILQPRQLSWLAESHFNRKLWDGAPPFGLLRTQKEGHLPTRHKQKDCAALTRSRRGPLASSLGTPELVESFDE
jgi:hypothetical protein